MCNAHAHAPCSARPDMSDPKPKPMAAYRLPAATGYRRRQNCLLEPPVLPELVTTAALGEFGDVLNRTGC
jgi:hypothetical protein